jgi:hypothetical protein
VELDTFKGRLKLTEADRSGTPQLNLTIFDEVSGLATFDILLDMGAFPVDFLDKKGKECEVVIRDLDHVGKILETRTTIITLEIGESKEAAIARVEKILGGGWKVRARDVGDRHLYIEEKGGYVATITRHVEPKK